MIKQSCIRVFQQRWHVLFASFSKFFVRFPSFLEFFLEIGIEKVVQFDVLFILTLEWKPSVCTRRK